MEKTKRLSLEDFKLNKLDGKTEIEKLLGGQHIAAACHSVPTTISETSNKVTFKSDPVP